MKKAIVTGASSGLGKAIAKILSTKGYEIIIVGRSMDKIKKVKDEITIKGGKCIPCVADLECNDGLNKIEYEIKQHNDISFLINNAGCGFFSSVESLSLNEWDQQFNVNVRAAFLLSQMVLQQMKNNKGSIVFINSVAGLQNFTYSTGYVASKFALRGFAGSLREELRKYGIKVMSVFPGAIDTPFWDKFEHSFDKKEMLNLNDCAQMIVANMLSPGNLVVEDLLIRRLAGDF